MTRRRLVDVLAEVRRTIREASVAGDGSWIVPGDISGWGNVVEAARERAGRGPLA